jgi:quercetin dioxygenase-like cupin family protein
MKPSNQTKGKTMKSKSIIIAGLATLLSVSAYASSTVVIAVGTNQFSELLGGPAVTTMRQLTIAPGEVLAWHYHPALVLTVIKQGTLTVEDGCGGVEVFKTGDSFEEEPFRVHHGMNLGTNDVISIQTFVAPPGIPTTVQTPNNQPFCGAPQTVEECKNGGWMKFNFPRTFTSQGDAEQYVLTGK